MNDKQWEYWCSKEIECISSDSDRQFRSEIYTELQRLAWQTNNIAPRDGTEVLLYCENGKMVVGKFVEDGWSGPGFYETVNNEYIINFPTQ